MYIEVRRIEGRDVERLDVPPEERAAILSCVALSEPALAFWWRGECLALIGFVPQALVTDTVYCWVQTLAAAEGHKVIFARQAILVVREIRKRYPRIIGHCIQDSSMRWLRSLGAKFSAPIGQHVPFVIED